MTVHVFRDTNDIYEVGSVLEAFAFAQNDESIVKIVFVDIQEDVRITYVRNVERSHGGFIAWQSQEVILSKTN